MKPLRTAAAIVLVLMVAARASAQGYPAIPNYTGAGAGAQFRAAINARFSGASPISPALVSVTSAQLGTLPAVSGALLYCADCQQATGCASGGAGALAVAIAGSWSCAGASSASPPSLTQNLVTGGHAINGSTSAGGDQINNMSVNGVLNAQDFGAVCSDTTASATTTASSATVTVGAIGDFKVGQYVKLDAAGASNTIATPTIASVTDDGYTLSYLPYVQWDIPVLNTTATGNGNCIVDNGTTNNPNTSCSTTYGYSVQNVGQTGIGAGLNGMRSAASSTVYVTTAPVNPSIGNAVIVTFSVDANTVGSIIRRCTGASCTPTSIYAVKPIPPGQGSTSVSYRDNGKPFGIDEEASTSAVAADLDAQITAISGTSVTLSVAPSRSASTTMRHDSAPAIQQAVHASVLAGTTYVTTGSKVQLPACATHYDLAQAVSFWQLSQTGISGPGSNLNGGPNANLRWDGPAGGIVFNFNNAYADTIEGIGLDGLTGSTPGILIDQNRYPTSGQSQSNAGPGAPSSGVAWAGLPPTGMSIRNVSCGVVGLCVDLGPAIANGENAIIDGLNCFEEAYPPLGSGNICIYSSSQETYNEAIYNTNCGNRDYCFDFPRIGSFVMTNTNSEDAGILWYVPDTSDYSTVTGGQEESAQMFAYSTSQARFSDFRIAEGSGPWGAIAYGNSGDIFENIVVETVSPLSTSMNWNAQGANGGDAGTFINVNFGQPLSNYGNSHGSYPATPYSLPITNVGGSYLPSFTCIHCAVPGQSVPGVVSSEPNQAAAFNAAPAATTLTGTAGTAVCSQSMQGTLKIATCYLNAYQETGTAQTVCFNGSGCTANLAGVNFSAAPNILASCGTYGPTSTATVLTLPANASMTAETCNITAIGQ